jgi:hypothetical protein
MRLPRTTFLVVALTALTGAAVTGCGSSSANTASSTPSSSGSTPDAQTLLRETFSGKHPVTSGQIELALKLVPTGSSVLTAPITIAFGGPFQSAAKGKLPQSDFTVNASAQGHNGKLSIVSTGSAGYITVNGDSYQLPAADFNKLKSGLSPVSGSSSTTSSSSADSSMLSKLGIDPLNWLTDPQVLGQASVGGVNTDHIAAKVNVVGLLKDLYKLAGKASTLGIKDASKLGGLSASEQSKIAAHIKSPSFDIWTGASDQTLRKLVVGLTVPVTGSVSKSLGGLSSVKVTLNLQYADLNQPQTISAPTKLLPYSEFQAKIASDLATIESGVSGESGILGGTTTSASSNLSGVDKRYSDCIIKAAGNVAKQQACTSILGG